jgi:hypothetical protein
MACLTHESENKVSTIQTCYISIFSEEKQNKGTGKIKRYANLD